MVGVTRLELATSRPPAVRATNCATPRYIVKAQNTPLTLDIPRELARWVFSVHFHGNEPFELPIKYDIQENHIRLSESWDSFIISFSL
jgi:hypothetical protein